MGKVTSDEILNDQETRPKYTNKLHKNKTFPVNNNNNKKVNSIKETIYRKEENICKLPDTGCIYVDK